MWDQAVDKTVAYCSDRKYESVKKRKVPQWCVKETQEPTDRAPSVRSWNNLNDKINSIILDYNPDCTININESILT